MYFIMQNSRSLKEAFNLNLPMKTHLAWPTKPLKTIAQDSKERVQVKHQLQLRKRAESVFLTGKMTFPGLSMMNRRV